MAKKSKTQRAKASARRAERKAGNAAAPAEMTAAEDSTSVNSVEKSAKGGLFNRANKAKSSEPAASSQSGKAAKSAKTARKAEKKSGFIAQVRSEMKRVTWPTRQDVLRWSGVVVAALVFFSVFVFVLDNWVVTPVLLAFSSLGA